MFASKAPTKVEQLSGVPPLA